MAENNTRMGVVGERDAVLAFKAVGMRVIAVETPEQTTAPCIDWQPRACR